MINTLGIIQESSCALLPWWASATIVVVLWMTLGLAVTAFVLWLGGGE